MRIDKPIGFLLLMWPVLWAFLISSNGSPNIFYMIIFAFGIIFTRSAGCIINDYFDQDFDSKVERTKNRVLATKEVTNQEALILFGKNDIRYALNIHYFVLMCFIILGITNNFSLMYYIFLLVSLLSVIYQHLLVTSRKPFQCVSAFENNNIFGLIITFGLLFTYI
jgi:4-hydroxybenzoate polyprenyltransferase